MANENEMNVSEVQEPIVQDNPVVSDEPSNPISERVTVSNDQSDDEVLDKIMGVLEDEPDPSSLTETIPDVPQEESFEPVVEKFESDTETRSEPGEEFHRAMAALQRDGTPRHLLDEYYEKDPADFVQWGLKREKVQRDGDRFSDEHAKLKETAERILQSQQGVEQDKGQGRPQNAKPMDMPTPDNLAKYQQQISDVFGEDAAESIMAPMRSMASIVANLYMGVAAQTGRTEQQELTSTRTQLQERYPQLADDGNFNSVVEKMQSLYRTGDYQNITDLMTDAVRIRLADAAPPPTPQHAAKSAGQPASRSTARRTDKPINHEDKEDLALDAIFNGGGLDAALKAYNS
jgi:hypothetical protein